MKNVSDPEENLQTSSDHAISLLARLVTRELVVLHFDAYPNTLGEK